MWHALQFDDRTALYEIGSVDDMDALKALFTVVNLWHETRLPQPIARAVEWFGEVPRYPFEMPVKWVDFIYTCCETVSLVAPPMDFRLPYMGGCQVNDWKFNHDAHTTPLQEMQRVSVLGLLAGIARGFQHPYSETTFSIEGVDVRGWGRLIKWCQVNLGMTTYQLETTPPSQPGSPDAPSFPGLKRGRKDRAGPDSPGSRGPPALVLRKKAGVSSEQHGALARCGPPSRKRTAVLLPAPRGVGLAPGGEEVEGPSGPSPEPAPSMATPAAPPPGPSAPEVTPVKGEKGSMAPPPTREEKGKGKAVATPPTKEAKGKGKAVTPGRVQPSRKGKVASPEAGAAAPRTGAGATTPSPDVSPGEARQTRAAAKAAAMAAMKAAGAKRKQKGQGTPEKARKRLRPAVLQIPKTSSEEEDVGESGSTR